MSILSFLFSSSPESRTDWNQTQREALVDLLYLAIYADNHLSQLEEIAVKDELRMVEWEGPNIELYINDAINRARDASENPGYKADYLRDIARRLETEHAQARALEALEKVLASDGNGDREQAFLADSRAAFGR